MKENKNTVQSLKKFFGQMLFCSAQILKIDQEQNYHT